MGRSRITLLTLFTLIALTQSPVVGQQVNAVVNGAASVAAPLGADDVVARLMSFDRNRDGIIHARELPDRMQDLFSRGDASRDGTLDDTEIRALATTQRVAATNVVLRTGGAPFSGGGYRFGDQVGLSARSHITGALNDLMLESPTREQAQAIAKTFVDDLEANASADLLTEIEDLLEPEQLRMVKAALERQGGSRPAVFTRVEKSGVRVAIFSSDLARSIERFGLRPADKREALAAVERFNERLRPGDDERRALLKQMSAVLDDEERDNLRAALERRPLVKAGAGSLNFIQNFGAVEGGIQSGVIIGGGVAIDPPPVRVVR